MSGWSFEGAGNADLLRMAAELVAQESPLAVSDRAFLDAIMEELIRRGAHVSPREARSKRMPVPKETAR